MPRQWPKLLALQAQLRYLGSIVREDRIKGKHLGDGHCASSVACIGSAICWWVVKCYLLFSWIHLQKRHGFRCFVCSLWGANPHHHFDLQLSRTYGLASRLQMKLASCFHVLSLLFKVSSFTHSLLNDRNKQWLACVNGESQIQDNSHSSYCWLVHQMQKTQGNRRSSLY